jgi:valyl-tRNA synthetase
MSEPLETRYDPGANEEKIYKLWEKSGYFNPDKCIEDGVTQKEAEVFSIVLPPPNVTGNLHMGHAAMLAVEDILVRYARMRGKRTLWIPGTDHAAIATQSKVEKLIKKEEDKSRHDLGREEFLKRVNVFAKESHDTIVRQIKAMGASVDWSREAFTLDEPRSLAVRTAFKKMYDAGLIYRGNRVINWDPKGQTTVSDDEVVYEERKAKLYTFRYSKDFPIPVATTRPETKVGDTAVAVHPDDVRYKKYVGEEYDVEFAGVPLHIKIIADPAVDKEFGTGAVGVTPAHSHTDWEMAERHKLPLKQIIDEKARMMTPEVPALNGKKVLEAREFILMWLKENDLLLKEEETTQNVAAAERTGGIIEPLPKLQWFVDVSKQFDRETLKQMMRRVVTDGEIKIIPERFEKTYYHWIDNLRDWCISRQIWYGHRIPVWYRGEELYVDVDAPEDKGWEQDPDTLDTWFSSGLWTFSTLGWPNETNDLKTYHPTILLETGYDILFFWVARMILMTGFILDQVPFRTVYLHGLVRDEKGKKMSKSLGNAIDPLVMSEKYGADATRLSLIVGAAPGNDIKLSEDKIRGYRNFATKIWNAARFVLMNEPEGFDTAILKNWVPETKKDEGYLKELTDVKREVAEHIEKFELHLAAEKAYHYFWHTFADKIIEAQKPALKSGEEKDKLGSYVLLRKILEECLVMLHPFMPFVTEAIYRRIYPEGLLMVKKWED